MRPFFWFLALTSLLLPARGDTVLVLPFSNLSGSSNLDWIGESIAETVRESLASEGVAVLSRQSRNEAYRRLGIRPYAQVTKASIIKLGEAADAARVVYGTFETSAAAGYAGRSRGLFKITANIVDLRRLEQSRGVNASGALEELGGLQDRIAWRVLSQLLAPRAGPSEEQFISRRKPVRLDAMENYIRGLLATDLAQKHRFFTQAVRLDSGFSQPAYQLGRLRIESQDYRGAAGWLERVSPTDVHHVEATFLLGVCRYHLGDYSSAQTAFRRVLERVPAPEAWNNLGASQSRLNQPGALESFGKALEVDPTDPVYNFNVGYALWRAGEYDEAAESFRVVLDRNPDDALAKTMHARCLRKAAPSRAETRVEARERLKESFDESAFRRPAP